MAVELTTYPTNRQDAAEDLYAMLMGSKFRDGVYKGNMNDFEVYADATGMQVKVRAGQVLIGGFDAHMLSQTTVALSDADASNPRIDRIVLRLDRTDPTTIYLDVKEGTPASSPSVPSLTSNATVRELPLAQVRVDAGVSTIVLTKLTDERTYTAPRGIGTGQTNVITGTTYSTSLDDPYPAPMKHGHAIDVVAFQKLMIPAGIVWAAAQGAVTPSGWLPCDGRAVERGSYPALWAAIGTIWGPGNNSTTFNVPDFRNYILRGAGGNQGVGQARGSDTSSALITHTHQGPSGIQYVVGEVGSSTIFANTGPLADHAWDITAAAETAPAGNTSQFSIEQASKGVAWIIKAH